MGGSKIQAALKNSRSPFLSAVIISVSAQPNIGFEEKKPSAKKVFSPFFQERKNPRKKWKADGGQL